MQTFQAFRSLFDQHLTTVLERQIRASCALTTDTSIQDIIRYAGDLTRSGGKRVRPYLAWIMYQAFNKKPSRPILDILTALELFHVFGLMHDDIIDRGTSRHGIPTAHRAVATRLTQRRRHGDLAHVADGQAMLLGDLVFAWATHMLHTSLMHPTVMRRVSSRFYDMVHEVVVGQMLDVDLMTRPVATSQLVNEKMRLKTASYTFVRPMHIGTALANASIRYDRFCNTFGTALGLAFQIQDDMFDLTLSAKQLGKTVFSDLADRQHTVFTQYITDHGTSAHKKQLARLFGTPVSEKDRPHITQLLTDSGSLAYGQQCMNAQFDTATNAVQTSRLPEHTKQELLALVTYIRHRTA